MRDARRRSRDVNSARRYVTIRALPIITALALLAGCASLMRADPELRVAQTFDAFLTQVYDTTAFYDRLYANRLITQPEYDAFNTAYAKTWPTIAVLYRAYKAGEAVDTSEDFKAVRQDLAVFILTMLTQRGQS